MTMARPFVHVSDLPRFPVQVPPRGRGRIRDGIHARGSIARGRGEQLHVRRTIAHIAHRLAIAAFLTAFARPASAAQCNGISVTGVSFGAYDPFAGPRDANGSIRFNCNGGGPLVMLSAGGSGSTADRQMRAGSETLRYNVYADAARTQVFTWSLPGSGSRTITFHGRIPAGQAVPPGAYADTLTVTLLF
jgi:spore coat protein U-like protein